MRRRRHLFSRHLFYTVDPRMVVSERVEGQPVTLTGYPIVWNVLSDDRGGYKMRLAPGSASFATPTHALLHHEWDKILGCTTNGSVRLTPDDYGVKAEIDLPNTSLACDVAELVRRRDLNGMSFAMVDDPEGVESIEDGQKIITAKKYVVDEITITAAPAFAQARVEIAPTPDRNKQPVPVSIVPPAILPTAYAARTKQALQVEALRFDALSIELPVRRR